MNTDSVIASPSTTSTGPSPSTPMSRASGSEMPAMVWRSPASRSIPRVSMASPVSNSVASTASDGPLGWPW